MINTSTRMHNAVYNFYTVMGEASPMNFGTLHLPVHQVYKAVHLWWRTKLGTMGASAAVDNEEHMTVMNELASVSRGTLAISVVHKG